MDERVLERVTEQLRLALADAERVVEQHPSTTAVAVVKRLREVLRAISEASNQERKSS